MHSSYLCHAAHGFEILGYACSDHLWTQAYALGIEVLSTLPLELHAVDGCALEEEFCAAHRDLQADQDVATFF